MDLKQTLRRIRWGTLVSALLTVVVGILLIALPESSAHALCITAGVLLLFAGIFNFVGFFVGIAASGADLVAGVAEIAVSFWLFFAPDSALRVLMIAFGIILLLRSVAAIGNSFLARREAGKSWIVAFIVSAVMAVMAIVVLCNPFGTMRVLMIVTGALLIADGISDIVLVFRVRKGAKNIGKKLEQFGMHEVEEDSPASPLHEVEEDEPRD